MRHRIAAILCMRCAAAPQLRAAMAIPTLLIAVLLAPPAALDAADASPAASPWWRQMFSESLDGHGSFVAPHLDALQTRAASPAAEAAEALEKTAGGL